MHRLAASVYAALLDGELLVRAADGEVEALVVVVRVRVVAGADLLVVFIVVAALVQSVGDFGCGVVLFERISGWLCSGGRGWRTLLPQVTELARAPIGPGAASAVAARRMLERMAQCMVMDERALDAEASDQNEGYGLVGSTKS